MSLRHGILYLLMSLSLAALDCSPYRPASEPTPVARGLRFSSHNAAFDAFFADLHDAQLDMLSLPERELNFRKGLALELKVDGATANVLAEKAAALAKDIASRGTSLKLDIEGLEAVDEADTSAQMRVSGSLESDPIRFAEAVTRTARSELKLLAHLNAKGQSLQRLAGRAAVLDAEVDRAFSDKNPQLIEQVRRNLSDARLLISMMDEKRVDLSVEARRTVERLATAVTTNSALGAPNEPPLITFVRPPPPEPVINKEKPSTRKPGGAPAVRGGTAKSPPEANAPPAADFEP
jgi:hypothetical protein